MDPKGKVILVTGASSGIGLASARALARAGARVILAARSIDRLQAEAKAIQDTGGEAFAVALDVGDTASIERAVRTMLDRFGHVDVAINCAGNGGRLTLWDQAPANQLGAMIDTHLLGAERVARALLPAMLARGSGRIVNIASTVGWVPMPAAAAYSAAKAAVIAFSEALHGELRGRGIEICVFAPPHTNTAAGRAWQIQGPRMFEPDWVANEFVQALRTDQVSFLAGTSNRLLLGIRRLSPAYARYIMRRIGLKAIARKAA